MAGLAGGPDRNRRFIPTHARRQFGDESAACTGVTHRLRSRRSYIVCRIGCNVNALTRSPLIFSRTVFRGHRAYSRLEHGSDITLGKDVAAPTRILDSRNRFAHDLGHNREAGFGERIGDLVGRKEVSVEFDTVSEPLRQVIDFSGRKLGTIDMKCDQQPPARKFAGYTIMRLLGSGGMGEVYLARHPRLPRHDAIRVLPREVSARMMDPSYAATAVAVMPLMNRVRTERKRL